MKIAGLDLSLRASALVVLNTLGDIYFSRRYKNDLKGYERIDWILQSILDDLDRTKPELVIMESLGFASQKAAALAEIHSLLKYMMRKNNIPWFYISPLQLKKFCTGRGSTDITKKDMAVGIKERWKIELASHDEVDAYGLARMGRVLKGLDDYFDLDKPQTEVIDKLAPEWMKLFQADAK